jgi:hypothetical protein
VGAAAAKTQRNPMIFKRPCFFARAFFVALIIRRAATVKLAALPYANLYMIRQQLGNSQLAFRILKSGNR